MPATRTYSLILHAPATARTQLVPSRRYAETETSSVPIGGSAKRCAFRGMTVVSRTEAKGEHRGNAPAPTGGRNPQWNAQCIRFLQPITHWSFTFSAKERDSETGLSYFGSRYYSSDLSIWSSVDPMAAKYPSLSPYVYCANNPVKLVDPNGDSIINGLKYAYDYFLQQCNLAIEKCLKLDYNSNPIEYLNVKKEYDKASKNLEDVSCFYKTAEVAISNVKKYNKQLYNQMNNIKDDKGNAVDIVVLVNYSIGKYGNHSIPIQSLCPPSIIVQLNPIAKFDKYNDMGEVLSHEFGHLLYIIPNWSDYQNFLKTVNPSRHNGHDHDDPSGQEAHKQTQIYILNKIKQP